MSIDQLSLHQMSVDQASVGETVIDQKTWKRMKRVGVQPGHNLNNRSSRMILFPLIKILDLRRHRQRRLQQTFLH
jgi:hypothetical protein